MGKSFLAVKKDTYRCGVTFLRRFKCYLNIAHMGNNVKIPLKNRLYAVNLNGLTAVIRRRTLDNFFRFGIIYLYIK